MQNRTGAPNRKRGTNKKLVTGEKAVFMDALPNCEPARDPRVLESAKARVLDAERKEAAIDSLSYYPPYQDLRNGLPFMRDLGIGEKVLTLLENALAGISELRSLWESVRQDHEDAQWAYLLVQYGIRKGDVLSGGDSGKVHMNRVELPSLCLADGEDQRVTLYGTRVRTDGSLGKAGAVTRLGDPWKRVGHISPEILSDLNRESLANLEGIYRNDRFRGCQVPIGSGHRDPVTAAESRAHAALEAIWFHREVQEAASSAAEALRSGEARELVRLVPDLTALAVRLDSLAEALQEAEGEVEKTLAAVSFEWITKRYSISVGERLRSTTPRDKSQGGKGIIVSVDRLDHIYRDENAPVLSGTRIRKDGSMGKLRDYVYLIPGWWERS